MNKRFLSLLLTVAMLLTALVMVVPAAAEEVLPLKTKGYQLRVNASDTANGQSTVYLLKDGTFIVFDGGGSETDAKHLSEQLNSIAKDHGLDKVVVSLWVITHPHGDHVGFFKYWDTYRGDIDVKRLWYNQPAWGGNYATGASLSFKNFYPNIEITSVHAGEEYDFADVHIKILWAADDTNKQYYEPATYGTADYADLYGTLKSGTTSRADENNASTVMMMTIGGTKILMGGDAGYEPFEYIYNSTTNNVSKADLDCDIFQVTHHSVGSANTASSNSDGEYKAAVFSTPNNKHFAVMTPSTIILPAGMNVVNMTLSGGRAFSGLVTQLDGTKAYDGYYGLLKTFGIVDAAAKEGTATFDSEAEFTKYQSGTTADGKTYYMAGWLNHNDYEGTKGKQLFFEAENEVETVAPQMLPGASVRIVTDEALAGSGIRFTSAISAASVAKLEELKTNGDIAGYSFGTVVFRAESVEKLTGAPTAEALEAAGEKYVDIPAVNGLVEKDGGYEINAAIVNIKKANYGRAFAAVSYVEYTLTSGVKVRAYSAFSGEDNVRSIQDVAYAALNDLEASAGEVDGWNYRYVTNVSYEYANGVFVENELDTPMYSIYSDAQRAILKEYLFASQENDFEGSDDTLVDPW